MRKIFYLAAAILSLVFCSCETAEFIQHTPTLTNTGQHTGKGQLHGRMLYSTASSSQNSASNSSGSSPYEKINGIQAQGSYSFASKFAVQASYMHSSEKGGSVNNGLRNIVFNYNRNIAETGFSFFDNIDKRNSAFVEFAAGAGFGKYNATEPDPAIAPGGGYYNHNVFKLYFQPSLYYASENFCTTLGIRYTSLGFNKITTNYSDDQRKSRSLTTASSIHTNTTDLFLKTDFYLSDLPWLGFTAQFQYCTDLEKKLSTNINDWNAGLGFFFRLDKLKLKK